jgi:SNF2 family DNA or RNA helicase/ubiquinone/menaquinone biosynthesis C-methylase UbiE
LRQDFPDDTFWDEESMVRFFSERDLIKPGTYFPGFLKSFLEQNPTLSNDVLETEDGFYYPQNLFNILREAFISKVGEPVTTTDLEDPEPVPTVTSIPLGWARVGDFKLATVKRFADMFGKDKFYFTASVTGKIQRYVNIDLQKENKEIYEEYLANGALPANLLEEISAKLFGTQVAKKNWVTLYSILHSYDKNSPYFGATKITVERSLEEIRTDNPKLAEEVQKNVSEFSENTIVKTCAYSPELATEISKRVKKFLEEKESRLEENQKKRDDIEERKTLKSNLIEERKKTKDSLDKFLHEVVAMSPETLDFRKLLGLFGAGCMLDLLFAFHPEFKRLPVEYLKNELAKYLGDYMIVRSGNVLQDVELALPYLGEKSFQDSLFTVIKEDAIHYYQTEKKKHKEKEDTRILDEYITLLRDKAILFHNEDFTSVVSRVEAYLFSLTNDFHKPESIVDEVSQGRTFPDLNQTINIKEVRDGKRVLIGDEMGMGKSASAILSKEYLGVGTALVVVPSNVISTWHRYLSDAIGPDGKQLGYFKKGCAPKVLELESVEDIELITSGEYDYVLISHEKFKEEYAERLKNQPIEMVIIDEVHKFKNVTDGKRSQALLDLMQEFKDREAYTVLLSGTPVPNKIKDLAITLKLLYPEEFGGMDTNILVSSIIKGDNINLRDLLFKKTQMKKLTESVEMPEKTEQDSFVTLSEKERELYELLLEDDELTATEKLQTLRQFCLNPRKIFPDVEIESSKVQEARDAILSHFETKNKMVFFVNGYIDGIIRGENSIIEQLQLPEDITVKIIDGDVSKDERTEIERDIKYMTQGKILLVLSGMAADVGVDFSSAEGVYFYNEPWTKFDKMQQQARVYRPGLTHDITVDTSLVEGSIEEGIHYYLEMKYKAIMKLLEGVPLSEIEQSMLLFDEKVEGIKTIDGDQGLAEEWLQSPVNRLNRFFGATKEIGEDKFMGFLEKYGEEYAEYYADMGTRGFQANTARLVTALIKRYREEKGLHGEITILDVASGPEMLAKKVPENEKDNVFSLDINSAHFKEGTGRQVVAGFTALPIRDSSVDYLNMSLAIHYSTFRPSKKEFERLEVFGEIARVLKVGGRATINLVYSLEWKNKKELGELLEKLGLKIVEACTGTATSGSNFASECLTFEKREDVNLKEKLQQLQDGDYELLKGLKLSTQSTRKLKKSQEVTNRFSLNGKIFEANLNQEDVRLLVEQEHIQEEGKLLIQEYGDAGSIPKRELLKRSILRYVSGSKYKLVKKSSYTKTFIHMN